MTIKDWMYKFNKPYSEPCCILVCNIPKSCMNIVVTSQCSSPLMFLLVTCSALTFRTISSDTVTIPRNSLIPHWNNDNYLHLYTSIVSGLLNVYMCHFHVRIIYTFPMAKSTHWWSIREHAPSMPDHSEPQSNTLIFSATFRIRQSYNFFYCSNH